MTGPVLDNSPAAVASGSAVNSTTYTFPAVTAGRLVVLVMAGDKNTGALTVSDAVTGTTGWVVEVEALTTSTSLYIAYKTAAGGESVITLGWATAQAARSTVDGYVLDQGGTEPWAVLARSVGAISETTTNSKSTGTTAAAAANGFAVAAASIDSVSSVTSDPAFSNSYALTQSGTPGVGTGDAGLYVGTRSVTAGQTTETTFSYVGTPDQINVAVVVFGRAATAAATVDQRWVGPDALTLRSQNHGGTVRVAFSTSAAMTNPVYSSLATPNAQGITRHALPALPADTVVHYQAEAAGVLVGDVRSFRTLPGTAAGTSFTFAFAACRHHSNTNPDPNPPILDDLIARAPDLFIQHGDFHYQDITTNTAASFRAAYDEIHSRSRIAAVLRSIPTTYTWSDHDFGGNASHAGTASRPAAQSVYRERVPHPTLPSATGGIYHTFRVGRVRFVVLDGRSFRSNPADVDGPSKTLLGAEQKAWLQGLLAAPDTPLTFIVSEVGWIGGVDDEWAVYATEHAQVASWVAAAATRVVMLCGDAHMLAVDNGTNSPGGVRVWHAAPLNQVASSKGGPYSGGTYTSQAAGGRYGLVDVADSGSEIVATFSGITPAGAVWATDSVTVSAPTTRGVESLSRVRTPLAAAAVSDVVRHDDVRLSDSRVPSGWVDAARAGAAGDGTADDTAALQAAINSLPASGGVLHLAPNATYRITAALTARSWLEIDGNGSHIRQDTAAAHGLAGVDITGLRLRNLTIRRGTALNGTGKGVNLTRSVNAATVGLLFENVTVRDFGGDGIDLSNPIVSSFRNVTARGNGGHGWNVHGVPGGAAGTSCRFDACYADANLQSGFRLENMVYTSLGACAADLNGINYELVACQGVELAASGCETPANRSANYPGHNVVVRGGFGVVLDALWTYESLTTSLWVTDSARGVVVRGMAENSPQAAATHCIRVDAGCRVTIEDCNNVRPYSLAGGTTTILNDGGGLSVPGYVYGAGTAYFEGEVGTSDLTPSADTTLTPRGWVNAQIATRVPVARVAGGGEWDRNVYGDLLSTGHRDDASGTQAMSASIRTYMLLLGRLPAGDAVTGLRLARTVAPAGTGVTLTAALFGSTTVSSMAYTRLGAGTFTVPTTGTGLIMAPFAVAADTVDRWVVLQLVLAGTITTFPTWSTSPALPAAVSQVMAQGFGVVVSGYSSATAAPGTTVNPGTGWTLNPQKPWAALY